MVGAMAKAEAAQARAAHAQKEIKLKIEQARVQATLDAFNLEKEKDAAIAEANALSPGLQDMECEVCSKASDQVPQSVKDQRVAAYVSVQASLCSRSLSARRGSDYALSTLHPQHFQPNDSIFSTPQPLGPTVMWFDLWDAIVRLPCKRQRNRRTCFPIQAELSKQSVTIAKAPHMQLVEEALARLHHPPVPHGEKLLMDESAER
ncbi:hypothetical protein E1301_Tti017777 [Triplophysa tibetana]|uniref:Uncharacterized protein n=1 Tax=Triplophysa tibetana TaxID=1572043 RepID=A0A5A9N653_9TELE|nr:hypothetical protein E1301_Tti017777 [Triplophysa tibetana]